MSLKHQDRTCLADLIGRDAVISVVDEFYNQIQTHPTLAAPFSAVHDWPGHKEKIGDFWWVVLGGKPQAPYKYDPVGKHFAAGFNSNLLEDWKQLFKGALDSHLDQELANKWFSRVQMIGENLLSQNERLINEN
jgi:hemoglobin